MNGIYAILGFLTGVASVGVVTSKPEFGILFVPIIGLTIGLAIYEANK